jgi:hypothetical protein
MVRSCRSRNRVTVENPIVPVGDDVLLAQGNNEPDLSAPASPAVESQLISEEIAPSPPAVQISETPPEAAETEKEPFSPLGIFGNDENPKADAERAEEEAYASSDEDNEDLGADDWLSY